MTLSVEDARRLALDDALSAHPRGQVVVIGCGNLLRGDDAVGPILVRHLWEQGVPDGVTLVDGGTAGMDVAFKMRGARQVIIVDAAATGADPGTIYRVPGEELEDLPSLDGLHMHQFRWDHALSFGRWLLKDEYPSDITVYLIEAAQTVHGAPLSPPVEAAMHQVGALIRAGLAGEPAGGQDGERDAS
jgi:hydrogenase maturation protease